MPRDFTKVDVCVKPPTLRTFGKDGTAKAGWHENCFTTLTRFPNANATDAVPLIEKLLALPAKAALSFPRGISSRHRDAIRRDAAGGRPRCSP